MPTVVFIHGAWVTPACWDQFAGFYTKRGYRCLAPPWPRKDRSIEEQRESPSALAGLGGIIQIDRRGIILGFVPLPSGDTATNFAFGGPENQCIFMEGATSGTFWRFKAPYPGLIGPGGARLPAQ